MGMPECPAGYQGAILLRAGVSVPGDNVLLPSTALPASALPTPGSSTAHRLQHVPRFLPSMEGKLKLPSSSWHGTAKIFLLYVQHFRSADEKGYKRPRYSTVVGGPYIKNVYNNLNLKNACIFFFPHLLNQDFTNTNGINLFELTARVVVTFLGNYKVEDFRVHLKRNAKPCWQ